MRLQKVAILITGIMIANFAASVSSVEPIEAPFSLEFSTIKSELHRAVAFLEIEPRSHLTEEARANLDFDNYADVPHARAGRAAAAAPPGPDNPEDKSELEELRETSEETPYSDMLAFSRHEVNKDFGLYGNSCTIFGPEIEKGQRTADKFEDDGRNNITKYTKKLNDEFQVKVCKLSHRLECVRDRYIPEPRHPDDDIELEVVTGTCRCIRALSERAIFLATSLEGSKKNKKNKKFRRGCYIPAGFARASRCDHIVALPYGIIETVGTNTRFPLKDKPIRQWHIGNTSKLCVPHSQCRKSWSGNYLGFRCMCDKNTKWHAKNGTCERVYTRKEQEEEADGKDEDFNSSRLLEMNLILVLLSSIYNLGRNN